MGWTKKQNVLPTYNAFDGSLPRVLYPASAHSIGIFGIFVKCNGSFSNAMMTSSIARIKWRTKSGNAASIYCIGDVLQESRWGRRMAQFKQRHWILGIFWGCQLVELFFKPCVNSGFTDDSWMMRDRQWWLRILSYLLLTEKANEIVVEGDGQFDHLMRNEE